MNKKVLTCIIAVILVFAMTMIVGAETTSDFQVRQNVEEVNTDSLLNTGVSEQFDNYSQIASSSNFGLFADKNTGLFYLEDKLSGARWFSIPPDQEYDEKTTGLTKILVDTHLIIEYTTNDNGVITGTLNTETAGVDNKFKLIDNGFRVDYDIAGIGAVIPVEYCLKNDYFEATILTDKIKESKEFKIISITLLPMLGSANWKENGYMFVPDGCGALIKFNNNALYNTYESMVYGEELSVKADMKTTKSETVRMPVFATIKDNGTLMGIIDKGDASSAIFVRGGNDSCGYNSVSSKLYYRILSSDTMLSNNANTERKLYRLSKPYSQKRYSVRYYSLCGENSGYVGVANKYRTYLFGNAKPDVEKFKTFNVDIYGAFETKGNFLGITYRKLSPLTTFSEVLKITENIKKKGEDDFAVRLKGFGKDGITNYSKVNNVKYSSILGGKKSAANTVSSLKESDIDSVFDFDILRFRNSGRKQETKTVFNKTTYLYQFLPSVYSIDLRIQPSKLLSPDLIKENADKFIKSLKKEKINSVSLSTLSEMLYSNFAEKNPFDRSDFPKTVKSVLKEFKKNGISVSGEAANAYAIPYLTKIYNAPISCSSYKLFDKEIPFYQLVVHGYVSLTMTPKQEYYDSDEYFLKAAEYGSELLYNGMYRNSSILMGSSAENLYSSTYKYWVKDAVEHSESYKSLNADTYNKTIVSHKEIFPNVMMTVYSNGHKVIVNYTNTTVEVEGKTVKSRSFIDYTN